MLKLTLENGNVIDFYNDEEDLNTKGMLMSLFDGECSAREGDFNKDCSTDYIVLTNEIEACFRECYLRVVKVRWDFAADAHQRYIEKWMNRNGIDAVFKLLENGIPKGEPTFEKTIYDAVYVGLGIDEPSE